MHACPVEGVCVEGVVGGHGGYRAVPALCVDVVGNPLNVDKTEKATVKNNLQPAVCRQRVP